MNFEEYKDYISPDTVWNIPLVDFTDQQLQDEGDWLRMHMDRVGHTGERGIQLGQRLGSVAAEQTLRYMRK